VKKGFFWLSKIGFAVTALLLLSSVALKIMGPQLIKPGIWTEDQLKVNLSRLNTSKPEEAYLAMEALLQHHRMQDEFKDMILQLNLAWSFMLLLSLIVECLHRTKEKG